MSNGAFNAVRNVITLFISPARENTVLGSSEGRIHEYKATTGRFRARLTRWASSAESNQPESLDSQSGVNSAEADPDICKNGSGFEKGINWVWIVKRDLYLRPSP